MKCDQVQHLLEEFFDDELSSHDRKAVTRHMDACTDCTSIYEHLVVLYKDISDSGRHKVPAKLRERVKSALENEAHVSTPVGVRSSWFKYAAPAVAAGLVLGWLSGPILSGMMFGRVDITQEIVAAHVRSLMADHLTDFDSSDMHAVKPWFNGKLDFSPPVYDFTNEGFSLIGGRLDYLDDRPVAALLYKRRLHVINLFIWPGSETRAIPLVSRQGYNILNWEDGDLTFWAISDLNKSDIEKLRDLLRRQVVDEKADTLP